VCGHQIEGMTYYNALSLGNLESLKDCRIELCQSSEKCFPVAVA